MKKYTIPIIILILLIGGFFAARFYNQNLKGISPTVSNPAPTSTEGGVGALTASVGAINTTGIPLTLPDGFSISTFASNVTGARVLVFDPQQRLVVSQTSQGKVAVLPDENTDGTADKTITLLSGLRKPHGLAFSCEQTCKLLVAEEHRVVSYDYNQTNPAATNPKKIIDLPTQGGGHFTRTLLIINTSEGKKLLTSIGSSCNVCNEDDARRAAIYISNLDGSDFKPYATGLRNSVFMAVHPLTKKVWATEMGRDNLGDNVPPEEINIIEQGKHYGWPICYDDNIHDTQFDKNKYIQNPCNDKIPPHIKFQAHSAPLGLTFLPKGGWPEGWENDLLIAYHGSWNRSVPTGYKIVRYDLDDNGNVKGTSDFISGFLKSDNKTAYGRPVDILALPGGVLYVSDDHAGNIYRVTYTGN